MDKIDKKELEEILAKHAKNTDDKLELIADDVSSMKENISHLTERMDHVTEKVDHLTEKVDHLTEKVDVIFEQTGKLTVDMEIVKESVQRHEQKIGQI